MMKATNRRRAKPARVEQKLEHWAEHEPVVFHQPSGAQVPGALPVEHPRHMVLTLPYPPSVNMYWRTPRSGPVAGRTMISEAGRKYRTEIGQLIMVRRAAAGLAGRLRVDIAMHAPDKRARDVDNIAKSLLDALTHAGVWVDDEQIDDLRIHREAIMRGGQVVVWIEEISPAITQGMLL